MWNWPFEHPVLFTILVLCTLFLADNAVGNICQTILEIYKGLKGRKDTE